MARTPASGAAVSTDRFEAEDTAEEDAFKDPEDFTSRAMRRGVGSAPFLRDRAMGESFKDIAVEAIVSNKNECGGRGRLGGGELRCTVPGTNGTRGCGCPGTKATTARGPGTLAWLWLTFQETFVCEPQMQIKQSTGGPREIDYLRPGTHQISARDLFRGIPLRSFY